MPWPVREQDLQRVVECSRAVTIYSIRKAGESFSGIAVDVLLSLLHGNVVQYQLQANNIVTIRRLVNRPSALWSATNVPDIGVLVQDDAANLMPNVIPRCLVYTR